MTNNRVVKWMQICCACFLIFISPAIRAQQLESPAAQPTVKNSQYYAKKQKNQKTTAWIMLGGGLGLTLGGAVIQAANLTKELLIDPLTGEEIDPNYTGFGLVYVGLASMVGSIPFFIVSGKNKERAKIALQTEKITRGMKPLQNDYYPSIAIRVSLGTNRILTK